MKNSFSKLTGYFTKIPNALINNPNITPSEKAIVAYLAMFEEPYPSYEAIGEATGLSPNTIERGLKSLRKKGIIEWKTGKKGRNNEYEIHPVAKWKVPIPKTKTRTSVSTNPIPAKRDNGPTSKADRLTLLDTIETIFDNVGPHKSEARVAVDDVLRTGPKGVIVFSDLVDLIRRTGEPEDWAELIQTYREIFARYYK